MRTKEQLQLQARQIEERGRELWAEYSRTSVRAPSDATDAAVSVFTYQEVGAQFFTPGGLQPTQIKRVTRRIEYYPTERGPEYAMVEEESLHDLKGNVLSVDEPMALVLTNDLLEALIAGYQRIDEDRLREKIEPIAERLEDMKYRDTLTDESMAEVEAVSADMSFSPANRLRMRADAMAMLEGHLDPAEFITRTVERQLCFEPTIRVVQREGVSESMNLR